MIYKTLLRIIIYARRFHEPTVTYELNHYYYISKGRGANLF